MDRHTGFAADYIARERASIEHAKAHFKERIIALRGVKLSRATIHQLRAISYAIYRPLMGYENSLAYMEVVQFHISGRLCGYNFYRRANRG